MEELSKAFEDNKLNTEDEPINDENILIKLYPNADITLGKKSKGQHLIYKNTTFNEHASASELNGGRDLNTLHNKSYYI